MNRRRFAEKLWSDTYGYLPAGARVAIAGGGISGIHLAHALACRNITVTLFEAANSGGVRIPLMKACHTTRPRVLLWQDAVTFSRSWYHERLQEGFPVAVRASENGDYFIIRMRAYLRAMLKQLRAGGVSFERRMLQRGEAEKFDGWFIASGAALWPAEFRHLERATQKLRGFETYMAGFLPAVAPLPEEFLQSGTRGALVHRRETTAEQARAEAKDLFSARRYALFGDHRLVTRDRLPVVGFAPAPVYADYSEFRHFTKDLNFAAECREKKAPFLFQGMGYHALTYAPFLAELVARWLTGASKSGQNVLCALTPARFLPR